MLTEHQRLAVRDTLGSRPFECDRVFFFDITGGGGVPIDSESAEMRRKYGSLLDDLYQQPLREYGWPGNIVTGPTEDAHVRFFASYPFGRLLLVLSKTVLVADPGQTAQSPFDKGFLDAVAASVVRIIGEVPQQAAPEGERTGEKTFVFEELKHWRECQGLWRQRYGPDCWLAVKGSQVVADAASSAELDSQIAAKQIEPPILYVPPEGEDAGDDIYPGWDGPTREATAEEKESR